MERIGLRRLDTDRVAREVVSPGSPALVDLEELFGSTILNTDGSLNREVLGAIVFSDPSSRVQLEAVLHPLIWGRVERFLEECQRDEADCVVEVPLLFENRRETSFDQSWVVAAPLNQQIARLTVRNGWSPEESQKRIAAQMPIEEKIRRADRVIINDGTPKELQDRVESAWKELQLSKERDS